MRCHFCWDETEEVPLTKEHLLSKPVAAAFGIDRANLSFGRFDPAAVHDGDLSGMTWSRLDGLSTRLACAPCNNGWMNALEHEMGGIAKWYRHGGKPLGGHRLGVLRRWLLKSYVVLSVIEGGTRRFMGTANGEVDFAVLPEVTRASMLRRDDPNAFEGVAFGLARSACEGFNYGFGNPTVVPVGSDHANARSAGVAAVSLGSLQAWVVVPWFRHATTRLPRGVAAPHPQLRANRLQTVRERPDTLAPVVDNGQHDIDQLMSDLQAWAAEETRRRAECP